MEHLSQFSPITVNIVSSFHAMGSPSFSAICLWTRKTLVFIVSGFSKALATLQISLSDTVFTNMGNFLRCLAGCPFLEFVVLTPKPIGGNAEESCCFLVHPYQDYRMKGTQMQGSDSQGLELHYISHWQCELYLSIRRIIAIQSHRATWYGYVCDSPIWGCFDWIFLR